MSLPLSSCHFSETEDDITYLRDDSMWIDSRAEGETLNAEEKRSLTELIDRLRLMHVKEFTKTLYDNVLKDCFGKDYLKELKESGRKNVVRNIFLAAIVREEILKTTTDVTMRESAESFLAEFPTLQDELGSDEELTYLNRYARALKILYRVYGDAKKMTLMIGVAAHLEGSSVFTVYPTGGDPKPETKRRLKLHQAITNHQRESRPPRQKNVKSASEVPVKKKRGRPRKRSLSNPSSPSSSSRTRARQTSEEAEELTLSLDKDPLRDFSPSRGNSPVTVMRDR